MSANERRAEIMRIMVARRQENMQVLAAELGVTDRTIRNDILVLTAEYPLETTRGNGGGVRIADWYHPHKNIFSQDQISVLEQLMDKADDEQKKVLDQNAKWLKRRKNFYETRNIVDGIKLLGSLNCYPRLRQYLGDWYLIYLRK